MSWKLDYVAKGSFDADDEISNHLEDLEAAGLLPDHSNSVSL